MLHHPLYTSGIHTSAETTADENLVPLFEQYGVDMVLSGHNHHYERSLKDGIYYIVTGGGGAPLNNFPNINLNPYSQVRQKIYEFVTLDINCATGQLEYQAWDLDGELIDGPLIFSRTVPQQFLPMIYH